MKGCVVKRSLLLLYRYSTSLKKQNNYLDYVLILEKLFFDATTIYLR